MNQRYSRRALWLGAVLGVIAAALPAVAADVSEHFDKTYPVAANVRVSLNNINGGIEVTTWERNEVQVVAEKHASSQEKLSRMKIDVRASSSSVEIKTTLPSGTNNNPGYVNYELRVPRSARLDKIETVNGSVEITGLRGSVKVSSVNGKVTGRALVGDIDLSTVNGTVDCEVIDLDGAHKVKLSTVNGSVHFSLPRDASAHLTASTVHGGIKSDFNLPIKNNFPVGSNLDTTLGSGTATVELNSVNGGISIHGGAKAL